MIFKQKIYNFTELFPNKLITQINSQNNVFMNSTFYKETYTYDENMGIKQNLCKVNLYHKPESVTYQQHSQIGGKGVGKSAARRTGTRTKQTARKSTGFQPELNFLYQKQCLNDDEEENRQEEEEYDDDSCIDLPLQQDKIRKILSEEEFEDNDESSSSSSSSISDSRNRSRSPVYRGGGRGRDRRSNKKKQKKSKRRDFDDDNDEIYNTQLNQESLKQPHRYRPQMKKKILCQGVQNISHSGTNFYNFLEQGAIILENVSLKLDHDKGYLLNLKDEIEKHKINLKKFRYLTLQISDEKDRQILKIYQISSDNKKSQHQLNPLNNFKDQKLIQPYDKNHIYFINREDYPLYIELEFNENKDNILQITNLKEIFDIILQLSQQKKVKNQAIKEFTEWKFLYDWHTFTEEQKFEKLTQYFSHELSFFLALRDPQFFQQKVKNIIKMKTQKQIIDFYLLEDWQQFKKVYDFQIYGFNNIQTFNFFEICLILDFEIRINKDKKNIEQIQFYLDQFNKSHSDHLNLKQQDMQQVWDSIFSYKQLKDKQTKENNVKSKNKEKSVQQYLEQNRGINQIQLQQQQIQQGYKNVNKTKQYMETQYYQNSKPTQNQNLITFNQFWFELANHIIKKNGNIQNFISSKFFDFFLTKNFAQNFKINQILLITILTSLQINSKSDQQEPSLNQIIFEKKYLEKPKKSLQSEKNNNNGNQNNQIIVNQYITNPENDTYTDENNIKQIKTVDQFETFKIYTLNTRLVNASFSNLIVNILLQIPEGAVQLGHNLQTDNIIKELKQLQTFEINIPFYFPETGKFKLYPASAIINNTEKIVGIANEITNIKVEDKIAKNKLTNHKNSKISFEELVYQKEYDIILEKLPKNELSLLNVPKKSLEKFIDYLKNNKAQFEKIKSYLQTIPNLQKQVLKLLLHHKDFKNLIHWFHDETLPKIHYKFYFKYFKLNNSSKPICDNNQYFEFTPLIQKRVMELNFGQNNNNIQKILNQQFRQEYYQFLYYLGEKNNNANLADYLMLVYYLILQENISQAKIIFDQNIKLFFENKQQIDTENEQNLKEFQVQIDYIAAYLDIYYGYPKFEMAFEISQKYLNFTLLNWRNMFISVYNYLMDYKKQSENKIQQLDVYQGQELQKLTNNNLQNYQFQDEHFTYELDSEKSQINLKTKNISELIIKAYNINVELLFSVNPFEISYKEINLKTIRCFKPQYEIKLPIQQQFGNLNEQETAFKIPKDLQNSNILFTLKSNNDTQSVLYSKSSLQVDVHSKMGQILVQNKGKKMEPFPKVYVKVFAKFKQNQSSIFYRDGYTDLNGRFDYAISSVVNDITTIDKFAIFVSKSQQDGCFITIVDPPSTLNQIQQSQNSLLIKRAMNSLGNLQFENENGRKIQKQ
ncbi:hypothetical protein PPERSA_07873 [Pseudocohnilembus persalinus]|uniref:Uncharacterized protein n=1 Tax=Pseudocohnilembus persalinus TaxID=266149 RepID=A0A0V0QCK8_PSEPJ|nr:hypothetical protein PPERSA_07873 [Pseudocohnilembus persalinus]|eukprot:KRW99796.1 hypothetical protein PPERSA_07873 [Pseudocohnilembus persalinus]